MIEPRLEEPDGSRPLLVRLGWMALYWLASVATIGFVAAMIRWWLKG